MGRILGLNPEGKTELEANLLAVNELLNGGGALRLGANDEVA